MEKEKVLFNKKAFEQVETPTEIVKVDKPTEIKSADDELKEKLKYVKLIFPQLENVKEEEIIKALSLAKYLDLDPLNQEVYFVPFRGSVKLITSYLVYIRKAEETGKLNGFRVDLGYDEKLGDYAEVTIYRKDWEHPFTWRVYMEEAKPKFKLSEESPWYRMPYFMLKKVAISQGFRICFPELRRLPYEEAEVPEIIESSPFETKTTKEPWTLEKVKKVATPELIEICKEKKVKTKELIELFELYDGDQEQIIEVLKQK
jgi:recombinational DNA repair protein RecT